MKKALLVMIAVLAAIFTALSIIGSGGEYAAEKLYYRAIKSEQSMADNPDVAPPALVASVEKTLISIPEKYPQSRISKLAQVKLAELYIYSKKYDLAKDVIKKILSNERSDKGIMSTAQFLKGNIYEKEGKWDRALKEYVVVRDNYTDTPLGLGVPMYIAKYYASKGMRAESEAAYNDAVLFYAGLERKNKTTMLGYMAANMKRDAYLMLKNFEKAGESEEDILSSYPLQLTMPQHLKAIDYIFAKELKNPEKAIEIYKSIKKRVSDENFKKLLDEWIAASAKKNSQS